MSPPASLRFAEKMGKAEISPHIRLGKEGEDLAARLLEKKGMRVLDRNWRYGHLELDLICEDGGFIVFVEVKTRSGYARGGPLGAINHKKRMNLAEAAQAWLGAHDKWESPCRFDVVCFIKSGALFRMEHYKNAFCISGPLDRGHAHW